MSIKLQAIKPTPSTDNVIDPRFFDPLNPVTSDELRAFGAAATSAAEMTIVDNRAAYAIKEFKHRYKMPNRSRNLARLNFFERYRKGCKFQFKLKVNRVVKARRKAAEKCRSLGLAGSDLK